MLMQAMAEHLEVPDQLAWGSRTRVGKKVAVNLGRGEIGEVNPVTLF